MARVLLVALALVLVPPASAAQRRSEGTIPARGVFVPGVSLAGVGLGMTQAQVKQHWGPFYKLCANNPYCTKTKPVWLFTYTHGEPVGVAAKFDTHGRTVAVFTLGAINGWKTSDGLRIADPISTLYTIYPQARIYTKCIGFEAYSYRKNGVTTTFYLSTGVVYGFALTAPTEPICQ